MVYVRVRPRRISGALLDPQTGTSTRRNFHLMVDTIVTVAKKTGCSFSVCVRPCAFDIRCIQINDENVTTGVEIRHGNGTVQHVRLGKQGPVIVRPRGAIKIRPNCSCSRALATGPCSRNVVYP
ncbi:hypothetical protein PsorP6_011441 [Peronosclerospora sorghi]|uniref:Uncharacterized protein n=1 Tax=Peronosclerospora sorghi TaxID=230839 RepID=A0ACC0WJL6_9STRA|nr:hypothetical protein PsorP6_011441 [Peronosclerospora sorghi]